MKVLKKRMGDIYLNPLWGDFWILKKIWNSEKKKNIWILELINDDYYEELENVEYFKKIGNIYDFITNELSEVKGNNFYDKEKGKKYSNR